MYQFFNRVKKAYYSFDPNFNAKPNDDFISTLQARHALPRIGKKYDVDTIYYEMCVRVYLDDIEQEVTFEASLCRFLELDGPAPARTRYNTKNKQIGFNLSYQDFQEKIATINGIFSGVFQANALHHKVGSSTIEVVYQYGESVVYNLTDGKCKEVFDQIKKMKLLVINNTNKINGLNPIQLDDIDDIYGPEQFPADHTEQFSIVMSM